MMVPCDKNGIQVEVGQEVIVRFRVVSVHPETQYCNVSLETIETMPPDGDTSYLSSINTLQTEVVKP